MLRALGSKPSRSRSRSRQRRVCFLHLLKSNRTGNQVTSTNPIVLQHHPTGHTTIAHSLTERLSRDCLGDRSKLEGESQRDIGRSWKPRAPHQNRTLTNKSLVRNTCPRFKLPYTAAERSITGAGTDIPLYLGVASDRIPR